MCSPTANGQPPTIPCVASCRPQTCKQHGVAPGCFCVGAARARELAALGYAKVGFDTDVNMAINAAAAAMQRIKAPGGE